MCEGKQLINYNVFSLSCSVDILNSGCGILTFSSLYHRLVSFFNYIYEYSIWILTSSEVSPKVVSWCLQGTTSWKCLGGFLHLFGKFITGRQRVFAVPLKMPERVTVAHFWKSGRFSNWIPCPPEHFQENHDYAHDKYLIGITQVFTDNMWSIFSLQNIKVLLSCTW